MAGDTMDAGGIVLVGREHWGLQPPAENSAMYINALVASKLTTMDNHIGAVRDVDNLAGGGEVEIWSNSNKWLKCTIHLDSTTSCRIVTKAFLQADGRGGGLEVQKSEHQCHNPDHLEQIVLQVYAPSEENESFIAFCVVHDERAYAVMTGTEACFAEYTVDGNFAPTIVGMPKTKEEKAKQQEKDAEHLRECAAAEAARVRAMIQAAHNANSNSSTT
ncbi:hypothetical protein LTR84_009605 [Exophiala bonariae]|uniref:Uncharacterized protein n=1 Tax=Exophiala bonariae TaxID=1690606 RepID=A0AAV9NIR2_9EURO|nr:hypothetical protein LTR84_009605 [Exophiala bonariae]